jgi:hypothetical protein
MMQSTLIKDLMHATAAARSSPSLLAPISKRSRVQSSSTNGIGGMQQLLSKLVTAFLHSLNNHSNAHSSSIDCMQKESGLGLPVRDFQALQCPLIKNLMQATAAARASSTPNPFPSEPSCTPYHSFASDALCDLHACQRFDACDSCCTSQSQPSCTPSPVRPQHRVIFQVWFCAISARPM